MPPVQVPKVSQHDSGVELSMDSHGSSANSSQRSSPYSNSKPPTGSVSSEGDGSARCDPMLSEEKVAVPAVAPAAIAVPESKEKREHSERMHGTVHEVMVRLYLLWFLIY